MVAVAVRDGDASDDDADPKYGQPGQPLNRKSPLYLGFVAAIGALVAYHLLGLLGEISGTLTLILVAAFIAIGLDPLVRRVQRLGLGRGWAVAVVFVGLLLVVAGFMAAVLPAVINQSTQLVQHLPDQISDLQQKKWVKDLDQQYNIITNATNEVKSRLTDSKSLLQLFGGILGAGKALVSGLFSVITVLALTLYLLASMNTLTEAGYRLLPASRRQRVRLLTEEIIRRIGGYISGQVAVASINGVCSFVMMTILHIPYALLLAIIVGLLGLIPMVGATIGAVVVGLVGLTQSVKIALIVAVYYVIYQQIENYLISPRVMSRTVEVPGGVALVAALIGGTLFGVLGALVAIPFAAAILLLIQQVLIPRQDQH